MSAVAETVDAVRPKLWTRVWVILLSLFIPGLGQAFLGRYGRGAIFTAAVVIAALILKASVFLWPAWRPAVLPVILIAFVAGVVIVFWAAIDSWRCSRHRAMPRAGRPKRYLIYSAMILGWFVPNAIALFVPNWRAFSTPSASMVPTLQPGDYLFLLAGYFNSHEPQRGDLVAFKLPCQYPLLDRTAAKAFEARCDGSIDFVKRIVGLPGERVQLKQGVVFINDNALLRETDARFSYAEYHDETPTFYRSMIETTRDGARYSVIETLRGEPALDNTEAVTVPPDSYFVLGDNRDNSADSRDPTSGVGYVPRDRLVGKAAFIYFSLDHRAPRGLLPAIRWDRIGMPLS